MNSISRTTSALVIAAICGSLISCNSFDEPNERFRSVRVIPTDERPTVSSETPPLPVSGGTLIESEIGEIASDPSRDRISWVHEGQLTTIELEVGSQPGRVAYLGNRAFAVVLRGTGEVVSFETTLDGGPQATELWRSPVCSAPRGLAADAINDQLYAACAGGELVTLKLSTGDIESQAMLDTDLRDVVAADGRLYVSRFRSAEVLLVDDGQISQRVELPTVTVQSRSFDVERTLAPTVAWNMKALPGGGVGIVHQRSDTNSIFLSPEDDVDEVAYGGSEGGCESIVQAAISKVAADGSTLTTGSFDGVVLPVDFAVSQDGRDFAVADAGAMDMSAPQTTREVVSGARQQFEPGSIRRESHGLVFFSTSLLAPATDSGLPCYSGDVASENEPVTSVAYTESGPVAQRTAVAQLTWVYQSETLDLGGADLTDTGHELFHRDSGAGLACASCHPEGADDGHVWLFEGLGPRRTQNLSVPLKDTAPFHWDGELEDVSSLMDEVFVQRMGGAFQTTDRLQSLQQWLFTAPKTVRLRRDIDDAVERGRALFESAEVGCASCHDGSAFTDNRSYSVGTSDGERLQVPSLVGIASHPPFMHDGCAKTLRERFDPKCGGGDAHGKTSQLADPELDDLISYLETL